MIKDIKVNEVGTGVFYCTDFSIGITKNGKKYASFEFRDVSGTVGAKDWNWQEGKYEVQKGDYVRVHYTSSEYQGSLQLTVEDLERLPSESIDVQDFCPASKYERVGMLKVVKEMLAAVENEWYQKIVLRFMQNDVWVKRFVEHSAAVGVHHAFVGGLLQHTLFVMRSCSSFARIYGLDYDLLITAAFLHDIGKLDEINDFPENDFSEIGTLYGHVVQSAFIVRDVCHSIEGFPKREEENLIHCILAHHGQLDYGSPKVPCMKEAIALHFADNLDAKIEIAQESLDGDPEKRNRYLGTRVLSAER